MRTWVVISWALLLAVPQSVRADDAGDAFAVHDAGTDTDNGGAAAVTSIPLACDGSLCDTTTGGASCAVARGGRGAASGAAVPLLVVVSLAFLAALRRTRQGFVPAPQELR